MNDTSRQDFFGDERALFGTLSRGTLTTRFADKVWTPLQENHGMRFADTLMTQVATWEGLQTSRRIPSVRQRLKGDYEDRDVVSHHLFLPYDVESMTCFAVNRNVGGKLSVHPKMWAFSFAVTGCDVPGMACSKKATEKPGEFVTTLRGNDVARLILSLDMEDPRTMSLRQSVDEVISGEQKRMFDSVMKKAQGGDAPGQKKDM